MTKKQRGAVRAARREVSFKEWLDGENALKYATREQVVAFHNCALKEQVAPLMAEMLRRYDLERRARSPWRRFVRRLRFKLGFDMTPKQAQEEVFSSGKEEIRAALDRHKAEERATHVRPGETVFRCEHCGKLFSTNKMPVHWTCPHCQRETKLPGNEVAEQRVHLKETKFTWPVPLPDPPGGSGRPEENGEPVKTCIVCGSMQWQPVNERGGLQCDKGHVLENPPPLCHTGCGRPGVINTRGRFPVCLECRPQEMQEYEDET